MKEEFRIPNLDEFIAGFEYQVQTKHTGGYSIIDFGKSPSQLLETHLEDFYIWSNKIVPNFKEKFYTEKYPDGEEWTWLTTSLFGTEIDYLSNIKTLLEQNKIRCKN